jgi:small subunit ribosomal protein S20
MPVIHKSTIRRARQAERHRQRNRATLTAVKSLMRKVQIAVEAKKVDDAKTALREAASSLSKAVTKGVLKRNTASRRISRLTLQVTALTSSRS